MLSRQFTLLTLFLVISIDSVSAAEEHAASNLVGSSRVLVIAHRGDSKQAPENTLVAFRSAVDAGADLVELDYYHSADGVPFVFHDKTLDRTTDAKRLFGATKITATSKTWGELQRLDAGSWFAPRHVGARIPTLEQALSVIQDGSTTLIERKGGDALTCVELLEKRDLIDNVVVQAFDWEYVAACHERNERLVLAALGDKELTESRLQEAAQTGARVIAWNQKHLGATEIAAIHRRGLKAWTYTVNEVGRANELIEAGIDGIITDVPVELLPLTTAAGE